MNECELCGINEDAPRYGLSRLIDFRAEGSRTCPLCYRICWWPEIKILSWSTVRAGAEDIRRSQQHRQQQLQKIRDWDFVVSFFSDRKAVTAKITETIYV